MMRMSKVTTIVTLEGCGVVWLGVLFGGGEEIDDGWDGLEIPNPCQVLTVQIR